MKISQLTQATSLDGQDLILLVTGGTNKTITAQVLASALVDGFNLASIAYVDSELTKLLVTEGTRIIVTPEELHSELAKKAQLDHNHDVDYSEKNHQHHYNDIVGTPEIPNVSQEDIEALQNQITVLEGTITALQTQHEQDIQALVARIEALENTEIVTP